MNKLKKYCIILSAIIISVSTLTNVYALSHYNNLIMNNHNKNFKSQDKQNLNIKPDSKTTEVDSMMIKANESNITNILLIGSDAKTSKEKGRSDSMIILTIDDRNKSLKLTSLARDTLVNVPGYGYEKLTHAYAYGGAELLLDTIEQNFKIRINDYVSINFNSFIDLVDSLGGVEVDIYEKDIEHLNDVIANSFNISDKESEEPQFIRMSGKQLLNGYQALAYARIRKLDTIYNRDERQRQVLNSIANRLSEAPVSNYPNILNSILPYVDINMSISKILKLAIKSKELYSYDIKQLEFPLREYRTEGQLEESKAFVVKWNKEENIKGLQSFIYEK